MFFSESFSSEPLVEGSLSLINTEFKLPIFYNKKKKELQEHIVQDLELIGTQEENGASMYECFFRRQYQKETPHEVSQEVIDQISLYYTTDTHFLKETQKMVKRIPIHALEQGEESLNERINPMVDLWREIKNDTGFKERYHYMDWRFLEFLNKSDTFLQFMSMYNMSSPVFSLLVPVFILIVPFFIIQMKGLHLTIAEYVDILGIIASNHAIGKMFTQFHHVSLEQKAYLVISAAFYIFSIYQNVLSCIRFYQNMRKIHESFDIMKAYIVGTLEKLDRFKKACKGLKTYAPFLEILQEKYNVLHTFHEKIARIRPYKWNLIKVGEIGTILKLFYEFYQDETYHSAFLYSFGFHGYYDLLQGLKANSKAGNLHAVRFSKTAKKNMFQDNFYGALVDKEPVKNNVSLTKNIILTGPNASGKTTLLKSVLLNVIFSQQFGYGFYEKAVLKPFEWIHCYLNIPDTSGRDSLFQAEARRCKEIIDKIRDHPEDMHFCVFDELYSGTNPEEATISATAFMEYLVRNENIQCLLTTHFTGVCKNLESNQAIENCHMLTKKNNVNFEYTYLLSKGISEIKGGLKVLLDMDYPEEIVKNTIYKN